MYDYKNDILQTSEVSSDRTCSGQAPPKDLQWRTICCCEFFLFPLLYCVFDQCPSSSAVRQMS